MLTLVSTPHRIRTADDPAFLTSGQVKLRYGVSDMWIVRRIKENGFPKGIRFGGKTSARHWRLTDLEKWEAEREAQS